MAIYTRDGSWPVEILEVLAGDCVRCRFIRHPLGLTKPLALGDLYADGGQPEIDAALTRIAGTYGNE
jgi:hypothetical protein